MSSANLNKVQKVLAARIKTLRKAAGLSQESLAHEADIDRTYVSQLERAMVNPSLSVLVRVSNVLDVSVSQLLDLE